MPAAPAALVGRPASRLNPGAAPAVVAIVQFVLMLNATVVNALSSDCTRRAR
jgi:hypothetical protein